MILAKRHYILRCSTFGMARREMYHTMVDILDDSLLAGLRHDCDIVDLFLHGDKYLSHDESKGPVHIPGGICPSLRLISGHSGG